MYHLGEQGKNNKIDRNKSQGRGEKTQSADQIFHSRAEIIIVMVSRDVLTILQWQCSKFRSVEFDIQGKARTPRSWSVAYNLYFIFRCYAIIKCKKGIYKKLQRWGGKENMIWSPAVSLWQGMFLRICRELWAPFEIRTIKIWQEIENPSQFSRVPFD